MSRESLLDEAIAKEKEAEDWQLVEWLRMARGGESAARWYTAKLVEARLDMSKLMAENAKLRELVRDMYKAFMHGNCYRWCEFKEPCNYISDGKCQWYDRMRELGVEVNDG